MSTDGSVVLLHDCGETFGANPDAPAYMLQALQKVLEELWVRNYKYVRIDEMNRSAADIRVEKQISVS